MGDVVEQTVHVERNGHAVPVALWRPVEPVSPRPPLVLLGHGGSGHKRSDRVVELARWFVGHAGMTAVAIDGPYHGDRVVKPLTPAEYSALIAAEGPGTVIDRMVGDWQATIAAVDDLGVADTETVGYLGLSMSSRYGLPLAAALGERLCCAVFGKFGLQQTSSLPAALNTTRLAEQAARRVTARTLFHVQWDDELFPRSGQLVLFDLLGGLDKRLIAFPGRHADTDPDAISAWRDFVASSLTRDRQRR